MNGLLLASAVVNLLCLVPTVGYVIRFHTRTKGAWRDSATGRHLMAFALVLLANLVLIGFNTGYVLVTGHGYAARVFIGFALYLALAGVLWHRWLTFEKAQSDPDQRDTDRHRNRVE